MRVNLDAEQVAVLRHLLALLLARPDVKRIYLRIDQGGLHVSTDSAKHWSDGIGIATDND